VPTPSEIFAQINSRLESHPSKTAGVTAAYAFDLSGDNGGSHHIVIRDGKGEAGSGAPANPGVTISMKDADFVDLATGRLDGTAAFMSGKLRITGDIGLAMKLQGILRD